MEDKTTQYHQGSKSLDRVFPLGTLGYGCKIEEVDYSPGSLTLTINSGLSRRTLKSLTGEALENFTREMGITEPSQLKERKVSVFINRDYGIEGISRRG